MVGGIPVEMLMSALCQIPVLLVLVCTYVYVHICKYASRQRRVHRNRIGGGPSVRLSTLIRREVVCAVIGHRISVIRLYL